MGVTDLDWEEAAQDVKPCWELSWTDILRYHLIMGAHQQLSQVKRTTQEAWLVEMGQVQPDHVVREADEAQDTETRP